MDVLEGWNVFARNEGKPGMWGFVLEWGDGKFLQSL